MEISIISGSGKIKFEYNYITDKGIKFICGEIYKYDCIVKDNKQKCNCAGRINTYYKIKNSYIPTSRAIKVE